MKTAVLISRDPELAARLTRVLAGTLELWHLPSPGASGARGAGTGSPGGTPALPIDLVLLDLGSAMVEPSDLVALRARYPEALLVGLLSRDPATAPAVERCDLVLPGDLLDGALLAALMQALRFQRLSQEVGSLRRERVRHQASTTHAGVNGGHASGHGTAPAGTLQSPVLKEMGRLLASHFDIDRVVEVFLDAITELVRPGRAALLLQDERARYRVRGHRGLDPGLVERVVLDAGDGLPAWFQRHARLAVGRELEREPEWLDAARELLTLGAEVAIPLWAQAKLVGILALGPRVTGQAYSGDDLERLFTLASQVAAVVEDIALFNTVHAEHTFVGQVLAHLASGAVTIDVGGRVTLMNRRAEDILGLPRDQVIGQDLRSLPSPLGDLLYETVRGGRELRREEVSLPRRPTFALEVSTARITNDAGAAVGAVLILDDPEPRHLLQRERETTQTLDLLNRVLLRLTDEIKNPLVSIYTFLELLPQRYEDPEFRDRFFNVVSRDTQNLISLVDKLMILAGEREYKVDFCDLRELLNDVLEDLTQRFERPKNAQDAAIFLLQVPERADRLTAILYAPDPDLVVRADRDQLGKALGYLLRFLLNRVAPEGRVAIHALSDPDRPQVVRLSILGKPAVLADAERERLFSPLVIASERLLDVGPSVSQKIVEAHGGTLAVGGDEGEIRFVLTLPRTTA